MTNKPNTNSYYYIIPADRFKKAQPLMVPFYAEEDSIEAKYINPKPQPMTKSPIEVTSRQKTSTTQPPVAEGQQR